MKETIYPIQGSELAINLKNEKKTRGKPIKKNGSFLRNRLPDVQDIAFNESKQNHKPNRIDNKLSLRYQRSEVTNPYGYCFLQ